MTKKIEIEAVEGRVPCFPDSGQPIPHGKFFTVVYTPQIKRMLKVGDIREKQEKKSGGKK